MTDKFFSKESEVLSQKGFEALKMLDPETAVEIFRDAIELDEKNLHAQVGMGQAYYELGKLSQAQKIFQSIIQQKRKGKGEIIARAYEGLATLYHRQGDLKKALLILEQAKKNKVTSEALVLLEEDVRKGRKWSQQAK